MKELAVILVVVVAGGFACGRLASQLSGGVVESGSEISPHRKDLERSEVRPQASGKEADQIPRLITSENVETLLARDEKVSYAALALWMIDADAEDIAGYWARCPKDELGGDVKRLIFLNWTRLDPGGAVAATTGTDEADMVWWAWAASDPSGALRSAPPEKYHRVAKGIGEFHPAWLMEHFDEIPEEARDHALTGLMTWKENDDPEATLDFLKEQGRRFHEGTFKAFALKDPWAAFDWLQKNGKLTPSTWYRNGPVEILIREMKAAHPDDLERMAATLPAGKLKRSMEDAVFESQLTTDPEKAFESAMNTEAPLTSVKRLGIIGMKALSTDPEKAFEIAAEMLVKSQDGLSPEKYINVGNSSISYGGQEGEAAKFFDSLIAKDPTRTLDMAVTAADGSPGKTFRELTKSWAEADLTSYASWVDRQSAPAIRTAAISTMVSQLRDRGSYSEAADWAMASPDRSSSLQSLVWSWANKDGEAAREWFEGADIPAKEKQQFLDQIDNR